MKRFLKRLLPASALDRYHLILAKLSAAIYGHPSGKMVVVGVTGTNGKSTVVNMISRILEGAGHTVGFTTTVNFKVADKEWLNDTKMTMLGRFALQRMLARMVRAGCTHAVIETSSEGIKQHRHEGINYDVAVFTNLTPEHLEAHGGFENYMKAKGRLFEKLSRDPHKELGGKRIDKVSVVNVGVEHGDYFISFPADRKYGYYYGRGDGPRMKKVGWPIAVVKALDVRLSASGTSFNVRDVPFGLKMIGAFNVENALAAISVGMALGIDLKVAAAALSEMEVVPGRLEFIDEGQPFGVLVDYAPEPESFRRLYEVLEMLDKKRIIHVFGSCGGGRDRDRRPILGSIAGERADIAIITNEDPYDDDPMGIIEEVAAGARKAGKTEGEDLFLILDRAEAIDTAVAMAEEGDIVVMTGKGAEQAIVCAGGRKDPWDERTQAREAIRKRMGKTA